jgi:hypothetical protein
LVVERPHQSGDGKGHRQKGHQNHDDDDRGAGAVTLMGIFASCHIVTSSICKADSFLKSAYHKITPFGKEKYKFSEKFKEWMT